MSNEEDTPRYPSATESMAALRVRVAAANAAGNAATAAAIARNNEAIAADGQAIRDINADAANAAKPNPGLLRVMFPD